jgi:hypothetical protein
LVGLALSLSNEFRYNLTAGVPKHQIDALENKYRQLRHGLIEGLRTGPQQLRQLAVQAGRHLAQVDEEVKKSLLRQMQCQVDIEALR